MKWGLKEGNSIDADSKPLGYVLWCCGSKSWEVFNSFSDWLWPYCVVDPKGLPRFFFILSACIINGVSKLALPFPPIFHAYFWRSRWCVLNNCLPPPPPNFQTFRHLCPLCVKRILSVCFVFPFFFNLLLTFMHTKLTANSCICITGTVWPTIVCEKSIRESRRNWYFV